MTENNSTHKVKVWDVGTITNGKAAAYVLGQTNFTNTASALTQSGFNGPIGVYYSPETTKLYVTDSVNNRIMIFDGTTNSSSGQAFFPPGYE